MTDVEARELRFALTMLRSSTPLSAQPKPVQSSLSRLVTLGLAERASFDGVEYAILTNAGRVAAS